MKERYHVIPMKSWGTLPMNLMEVWRDRHCDVVFTAQRMAKRAVSQCLAEGESTPANLDSKLPLIAVMAATTTRKVTKPSTSKLALFTHLLPSLVRSLDCGFRYEYVLGFDKGDPFYDSKEVRTVFFVVCVCCAGGWLVGASPVFMTPFLFAIPFDVNAWNFAGYEVSQKVVL
jgi:hypothetical protein